MAVGRQIDDEMSPMKSSKKENDLAQALGMICGENAVETAMDRRAFFASDLYETGKLPDIIVAPSSSKELSEIVKLARGSNKPVYVRGGGMSYSNSFLPAKEASILVDSRNMKAIREVNSKDLYVTVECGCTWAELDRELKPLGLRSKFWGPYSGGTATIGGGVSQGSANNAAAKIGTSDSAVLGYEIVTGTGEILLTGKDSQAGHKPFTRNYGPDLTSLFSNDAGALGIKAAVTLKLEPRPNAFGGVSFAFETFEDVLAAVSLVGQSGQASAIVAMDAKTAGIRAGKRGLSEDFKKLIGVVKSAHNPFLGVIRGVKIAMAGSKVFERANYTVHFLAEGANNKILGTIEKYLRDKVKAFGDEIPSVAISMMRLDDFPDLPLTHMDGRRMLPIHGILPLSNMPDYTTAYLKIMAGYEQAMLDAQVTVADIFTLIDSNSLLCEPVFYWPDSHTPYQREMSSDYWTENWPKNAEENLVARALVDEIKAAMIELLYEHGAAHIQIGKQYPYLRGRDEVNTKFVKAIKAELDPDNIINPGALGL